MKIFLNSPSPKESIPQTEASISSPDFSDYKQKVKMLESSLGSLRKDNAKKDEIIAELQAQIVTLTEENIHLRAKVTNFKDVKELSNGIEQTANLLNKLVKPEETEVVAKPVVSGSQQVCLFNEIDLLKEQLDRKKKEYDQTVGSFVKVAENKQKSRKKAVARKKKATRYVPSYLRKK